MARTMRVPIFLGTLMALALTAQACGPPPGIASPLPPSPTAPQPAGHCGDGVCDGPENAQNCPQDCVAPTAAIAPAPLPLYVTIYYHVEPNPQLFDTVERGYFEAVSLSLRSMSASLASINVHATFCFAWLYNDLAYCSNHSPQTGMILNSPADTSMETYEQILADGHELAYHTHPPMAYVEGNTAYYARPTTACDDFSPDRHRWNGLAADAQYAFSPGVYLFDDPADPWYGQFTWERTTESLFLLAEHLGATVRHANGGQRPLLDITNQYGSGINHEHGIRQIRSLMALGFDLLAPEVLAFFSPVYAATGPMWTDSSTGYVAYLGSGANVQLYYPDIDGAQLERAVRVSQGLTFMPVQSGPQAAWMSQGTPDDAYYNAKLLGGTGGGGVRWTGDTFYANYAGHVPDPWSGTSTAFDFPSLAEQFNNAMQRHLTETPAAVNAWGFDHHVVNVMWADLSGLSDNWDRASSFMLDIADGVADGVAGEPRPDLVQFVTMQELAGIFDSAAASASP
jgi:hypothetical protein